jgi:hypothetical protein
VSRARGRSCRCGLSYGLASPQARGLLMCMRAIARVAGFLGCLAGVVGFVPALAMAGDHVNTKPAVWHLHWTKFSGPGADSSVQDGPWVFVLDDVSTGEGVLFNLNTGTSTQLAPPAQECPALSYGAVTIGGGWLKFNCVPAGGREELYSLGTGTWSTFDSSVAVQQGCGPNNEDECEITPERIGRDWLEFSIVYNIPMSPGKIGWENLNTHAWKQTGPREEWIPGLGPRTMLDLDSPTLLAPVCAPLRLPFGGRLIGSTYGLRSPVLMFGQFGMIGDPDAGGTYPPSYGSSTYTYLERCGQRTRHTLSLKQAANSAANGRVLVWNDGKSQLAGMYLRSRKRFVSNLGTPAPGGPYLWITPRYVIQVSASGLWDAPLPKGA